MPEELSPDKSAGKTVDYAVLVTGSSSGIGAAVCRRLAQGNTANTGIVVHARRNLAGAESVAAELETAGAQAEVVLGDIANPGEAERLVDATVSRFGRLDALVANAGFPIAKSLDEGTRDDLDYAFRGNLFSFYELVRASRKYLTAADRGRVVAVGSFTAHLFRTDMRSFPMSSASKGALETMARGLAAELAPQNITVNCVVPGYIEKDPGTRTALSKDELKAVADRIPLGRIGRADEVAATIEFLLSPGAAYITGQAIHVNGGLI
jgi:3-oxoacyl-[acyl-carrier protein] reductase